MRIRRFLAGSLLLALVTAASAGVSQGQSTVPHDIDGDGFADLLVGVPAEAIGSRADAGLVNVIFGGSNGLVSSGNIGLTQGPLPGAKVEAQDLFGGSVELADVNGDSFADAIIGTPGEDLGATRRDTGIVHLVLGGESGLDTSTATVVYQGKDGVPGAAEFGDFLGWDLASGDFDADGFADVVVTAPYEDIGDVDDAGAVIAMYGSADGFDGSKATFFSQKGAIEGVAEEADYFGWSVAVGDFDGDGFDDLAVGVPHEDVGSLVDAGYVNVIYGSEDGLTTARNEGISERTPGVAGAGEATDVFGWALGASDMNCDGRDDLLIGKPNEEPGADPGTGVARNYGEVQVLLGSASGITASDDLRLAAGANGIPGTARNSLVGSTVVGGDFDGDGCGDLAFGAPVDDVAGEDAAGTVTVVYGSQSWPDSIGGAELFSQRGPIPGAAEAGDRFGNSLSVADLDGDQNDDLVVGAPGETIDGRAGAGAISVILGSDDGLDAEDSQGWSQNGSIAGNPETGDGFASSLQDGFY